jgi:DNA-binding MarR family transcriptional regulator/GNAT superfamily N-acetyltransferase
MSRTAVSASRVAATRNFNRFYTKQIGMLHKSYLKSPFSLTEVRVLYEIGHRNGPTATTIAKELGLDPGYLSRILMNFKRRNLIDRKPATNDSRQTRLSLTRRGRSAFDPLEHAANREVSSMLAPLTNPEQERLIESMQVIQQLLDSGSSPRTPYLLRPHRPGDMGWVIHRHGVLYVQEYGWDERFEAEVAEIAAKFIQHFDPKRERCWIAEQNGAIVGSIFLVRKSDTIAKLRLFLVEPSARGLGIGHRLVTECIRFARQAGYRKITLWTQSVLLAARHIYEKHGFHLASHERHHSFGYHLTGETWELRL